MNITKDSVPLSGRAEQGTAEEEAFKRGMEEKSKEVFDQGAKVAAKV